MAERNADPAASMLLLRTIVSSSLDPGYRSAAERKQPQRGFLSNALTVLALAALTWAATVAAVNLRQEGVDAGSASVGLAARVEESAVQVEALQQENMDLGARVEAVEGQLGVPAAVAPALKLASAGQRVTGPGLVVTVSDGSGGARQGPGVVEDSDLRLVMNALWSAGAEGMALDGNRIGAETSVRTAGTAILVNLTPVTTPYQIEAIGDPGTLGRALKEGPLADQIRQLEKSAGISVDVTRAEKLTLPAVSLPVPEAAEFTLNNDPAQTGGTS